MWSCSDWLRVSVHEGCGRLRLHWLLALADAQSLNAVVELLRADSQPLLAPPSGAGDESCRFCGSVPASQHALLPGRVCSAPDCQRISLTACTRTLDCGHWCAGIRHEQPCLPCLHGCAPAHSETETGRERGIPGPLRQDADDMCMICFAESLRAAPVIQLQCGHAYHSHCVHAALARRWPGPRITFAFMACPVCKRDMQHASLDDLLAPALALRDDVRRKALMRLEYEGLHARTLTSSAAAEHASSGHQSSSECGDGADDGVEAAAMQRYAYYMCYKCQRAYYGGLARCQLAPAASVTQPSLHSSSGDDIAAAGAPAPSSKRAGARAVAGDDDYDARELVCGGCSDVARAQMCVRHGADFLDYKCRYCCSLAVYFCFGTTHFCAACHDDFQRVTSLPRAQLPRCPAGPGATQLAGDQCPLSVQHPPTGEEFALGCGICRNAHTF